MLTPRYRSIDHLTTIQPTQWENTEPSVMTSQADASGGENVN